MTQEQITQSAQNAVAIANAMKAVYIQCKEFAAHETVMAYDWASAPDEVIPGTQALPDDISNAIFAMTKVVAMWDGQGVDAANYGQSFEKLANPLI